MPCDARSEHDATCRNFAIDTQDCCWQPPPAAVAGLSALCACTTTILKQQSLPADILRPQAEINSLSAKLAMETRQRQELETEVRLMLLCVACMCTHQSCVACDGLSASTVDCACAVLPASSDLA